MSKNTDNNKLKILSDYLNDFKVIGGTTTSLLLDESGISSRSTRDIDMIIFKNDNDFIFSSIFNLFIEKIKDKYKAILNDIYFKMK